MSSNPSEFKLLAPDALIIICCESGVLDFGEADWFPTNILTYHRLGLQENSLVPLGKMLGKDCYAVDCKIESFPDKCWVSLRQLVGCIPPEVFQLAALAWQVVMSARDHQYCGRCGSSTQRVPDEFSMCCKRCGFTVYPRISPCILTLVFDKQKILLARSARFPPGLFSAVAGFVEPAETLEQAVAREVNEEVGIYVKDVTYFASQSWPFPNQLMIAFHARYDSGILQPDGHEIVEAGWFSSSNLPDLPPHYSLSRRLIDYVLDNVAI